MAYIGRGQKEQPNFQALADICRRHKSGDCWGAMERLANQLNMTPKQKLRLRHLLQMHAKPYHTLKQ